MYSDLKTYLIFIFEINILEICDLIQLYIVYVVWLMLMWKLKFSSRKIIWTPIKISVGKLSHILSTNIFIDLFDICWYYFSPSNDDKYVCQY